MILFKYIEDKDVFQSFYTTRLSKRLIHGVSASDESEASMISKLKEACGFEYTNKLQRMFTGESRARQGFCAPLSRISDMSLSKDLTDQFKERMQASHPDDLDVSFSIMVLGTNFWPLNPPNHEFIIPTELQQTYDRFQRYYQSKHSGRKLTWLWNYSKNELRTNYLNQKYILMTSSYQTAILLQYNSQDTLSLSELVTATSIPKEVLTQILALLVKAKVLINEEEEQYDLNPGMPAFSVV
jgi:cullin 1